MALGEKVIVHGETAPERSFRVTFEAFDGSFGSEHFERHLAGWHGVESTVNERFTGIFALLLRTERG
jgi:hypothetical protein